MKRAAISLLSYLLTAATLLPGAVESVVCGPEGQGFAIAGSSTVRPVSEEWARAYKEACPKVGDISVEGGGSSAGAGRVCANDDKGAPVDIGDMSREWTTQEASANEHVFQCLKGNTARSAIQIDVAIDGLTVTTQANGAGTDCIKALGGLTTDQLRWIYSSYNETELTATGWDPASIDHSDGDHSTHLWSELSDECAAEEIKISGADDQSGTYEYFLETILTDHKNGETFDDNRPNGYFNSEEDEDVVLYLEANAGDAIGYFGYAYYFENNEILAAVPVKNEAGEFVTPDSTTVGDGSYNPLARRIYMNLYNDDERLKVTTPFIHFGMSEQGADLVAGTGYVPIPEAEREDMLSRLPDIEQDDPPSSAWTWSTAGTIAASSLSSLMFLFSAV